MASIKENNLELNYGWPYGESRWNSGMDENIVKLGFESRKRINGILSSPPSSPSNGDAYLVGTTPTGLFSGKFANIAIYDRGSWVFITPKSQEVVFNTSDGCDYIYNNGWSLKLEAEVSPYIKIKDFTFSTGYTITDQKQCLLNITDNHYYQWNGTLPKVVSAGSTPATAGGVGVGLWSDKTDLMIRGELMSYGASIDDIASLSSVADYSDRNSKNLNTAWKKLKLDKLPVTIVCHGDSITAGYDKTSADIVPATNGDWATHAAVEYPSALQSKLRLFTGISHTTINRGYSGDTAKKSYNRWVTNPTADIAHIMLGINDSSVTSGATYSEYIEYMELLIRRYIDWGCGVVLHTATPIYFNVKDQDSQKFTQLLVILAEKYNCPIFESETSVRYCRYRGVYSDGTHFNSHGYNKYGTAVAAFILAGGWVTGHRNVSSDLFLTTGSGSEGVGFYATSGVYLAVSQPLSYLTTTASGVLNSEEDRITYSFFMDTEFMDVSINGSVEGLQISLCEQLPAQYLGDTRDLGSVNRFPVRGLVSNYIEETSVYTVSNGRNSQSGKLSFAGILVGRGWKTISIYAPSGYSSNDKYFAGLLLQNTNLNDIKYKYSSSLDGALSSGIDSVLVYQYPYPGFNTDTGSIPASASLPTTISLPAPTGLLPYVTRGNSDYYDALFCEIDIQGAGAGQWAKVLVRKIHGVALEINQVAVGASGASLVPASASMVYKTYDVTTEQVTGSFISGVAQGMANNYIQLTFGTTPAGYYKIVVRDIHKRGVNSLL